ncbi:MAG: class I SAM-dependent methyltransferase [Spirochaetales bacterium]|nr:class I SAM-dependent methyltransferase [Spirochaetales bacterium]
MAKIKAFEENLEQYEEWFEKNPYVYRSEVSAIKKAIPQSGEGVEIGVGSGRFASPLDIKYGVDPSREMRKIAKERGIKVCSGIAEDLPYMDDQFDFALMVTTLCFLDDVYTAFREVHRILRPNGYFIVGFVDGESSIGELYQKNKNKSVFYKDAIFYSVYDVTFYLKESGFTDFTFYQTLFKPMHLVTEIEPVKQGYEEGSFIVVKSKKKGV